MDIGQIAAASHRENEVRLRAASDDLEISFLTEMLKEAGLGRAPADFGGGAGENQFASFLVREQASLIVAAGGIGLSETIFNSLIARVNHAKE
ncbi:rod-binding protein [Aestuariibius insulae]|uniref:rod-binding protein n=1 Tax=Aestuariibius insulae TaxID=2058287 RepID=UPI00345E1BBA